jgi:hypothetical protein
LTESISVLASVSIFCRSVLYALNGVLFGNLAIESIDFRSVVTWSQ